ncbi:MAG: hypothetical protein ACREHV_13365 [Rhizomicrobium sp.]
MSPKVLLLSSVGWPSVARLAAGFAHANCTVEALAPRGAAIVASRYLARWRPYRALFPRASMRAAIDAAAPDLLVCCDDRSLAQLLDLHAERSGDRRFAKLVEVSLGHPAAIPRLVSRNGFMAEARAEGIRVPVTVALSNEDDIAAALRVTGLPVMLKSDGSWGGEGVILADSAAEAYVAFAKLSRPPSRARSLARALRRHDAHYIHDALSPRRRIVSAQQFVAGLPAASAFAAWRGEVTGAIYYDVLVAEDSIGPPSVIRRVDCPEIREATVKIARRFGLSGIHGMDFIRDAAGAVHLIEINPRATQGSTLAFGPGRDLPAALAGCLMPGAPPRPAIAGDLVAFFPREWKRDPLSPYLSAAHHDVPWDDPAILLASLGVPARSKPRSARALVRTKHPNRDTEDCIGVVRPSTSSG